MRIGGYGSGLGGQGGGHQDRASAFRRRFRVGERIRGTYLRPESPRLGWVAFDGLTLLADIQSSPSPGQTLHFEVIQLQPEIILRELTGQAGHPDGSALLTDLARTFRARRAALEEAAAQDLSAAAELPPADRKPFLLDRFSQGRDLKALWWPLAASAVSINAALATGGSARLFYQPWLLPDARECETLWRRKTGSEGRDYHEMVYHARLERLGEVQLRLLYRTGLVACRVYLDRPEHEQAVRERIDGLALPGGTELRLLSVERTPRFAQGGLLNELLGPGAHMIAGLTG